MNTFNSLYEIFMYRFISVMNLKHFSKIKFNLLVIILTILFITIYLYNQRNVKVQMNTIDGLGDLQLNKIHSLLSDNERTALIREIVKESLKELMDKNKISKPQSVQNKNVKNVTNSKSTSIINPIFLQRLFHKAGNIHSNHSVRNSKLEAFQIQTTLEERSVMYTLLDVFDKTMKKNKINYFMYGGTLLGSFRHHDLIPWDDDLDVILSLDHHESMPNIFQSLSPEFTLYRAGGHDKFYHKSAKKASGYNWLWPYLDISYYEENGTYIKDWTKTYGYWYYFPKEIVFPLHNRPLLNLSLPAPRDSFAFLTWTYNYGSSCVMYGYSHMVEGGGPAGRIDCKTLADKFPFVEHLSDNNGVREILKYKDLEIRNVVIDEPNYAVAETFQLTLKSGFKMPNNITPPPA